MVCLVATLDVLPTLPKNDVADGTLTCIELLGKSHLGKGALSNHDDVGCRESGCANSLSPSLPFPFNHFSSVHVVISEMQVGGMNTDRSITPMQNLESIGGTVINPIRSAVRPGSVCFTVDSDDECPVSILVGCPRPIPAPFGKGIGDWWITGHKPSESFGFIQSPGTLKSWLFPERIAPPPPPLIVTIAPSSGFDRPTTVWDRTDHLFIIGGN